MNPLALLLIGVGAWYLIKSGAFTKLKRPTPTGTKPFGTGTKPFGTGTTVGGTYVVQSGDSLSKIAQRVWGVAARWPEIYNANVDVVGPNPNVLRIGAVLRLPPRVVAK